MLTIEVELLSGRYAATAHNNRGRAEWPPHPARFFSAMVAALHDRASPAPAEREALLWLERQEPPSLDVDLCISETVGRRDVLDVYVPVNDISLVGDPEKPLREARAALERAPDAKARKDAQELINKRTKELAKFITAQQTPDDRPSQKALDAAVSLLPDRRTRQVRTFPVVIPELPRFAFIWQETPAPSIRDALDALCERVTHLGHSSSLVRCAVIDHSLTPTLVPDDLGGTVLRVIGPGQLDRLERAYERHQGIKGRILPALPRRYGLPQKRKRPCALTSVFSEEWIVFERTGGARLSSSRGAELAMALRRALIEQHGARTLPEPLSGHRADGTSAITPHVAFVALPFVGREHADGSVLGCAIVLPQGLSARDRETLHQLVARLERERGTQRDGEERELLELAGLNLPLVQLGRTELSSKKMLHPRTWCQPARRFITATPIALDKNPGNLSSNLEQSAHRAALEAQRCIAKACEHIGLPRPRSVEISLAPLLPGAQPTRDFYPWPRRAGRPARVRVHADIEFEEDVRGPVILGAGRFFGLGLCHPMLVRGGDDAVRR